jgi:hypothetical protein
MGKIESPKAVKLLIFALKDQDAGVRQAAAKSLQQITGQDFGEDQAKWNKYWEENKGTFISSCSKGLCRF